jgi:hypothetical protein
MASICPPDPEIKRVVGRERWKELSEEEIVKECLKFNDEFNQLQAMLPGGAPSIPFGVYRFKTPEEADLQKMEAIMKVAIKR